MTLLCDKPVSPADAVGALATRLSPVTCESMPLARAAGRVLAANACTDRDSPPSDASAMDGYALRWTDLAATGGILPVAAEAAMGRPAPPLPDRAAVRIWTGACVPTDADLVVRREDVDEKPDAITIKPAARLRIGQNIRRRGENGPAGSLIAPAGALITPAVAAALAASGHAAVNVFRRVRVGILVTGDELRRDSGPIHPWHIRDSNGPAVHAALASLPWIETVDIAHSTDQLAEVTQTLVSLLARCDAIVITGGVSMGDHDHVPAAVRATGAEILYHKLPIRPGHPNLGAVAPGGRPVLALPGNPVAVLCALKLLVEPTLRRLAGSTAIEPPCAAVHVIDPDDATLPLWWYRPARRIHDGTVSLLPTRGSGDTLAAARSDGFVEVPPHEPVSRAPRRFFSWSLA